MKIEELMQAIASYEAEHPVEEYRFYDWNVWPLLRLAIAESVINPSDHKEYRNSIASRQIINFKKLIKSVPIVRNAAKHVARKLSVWLARKALIAMQGKDCERNENVLARGREVVIFTISQRRQLLNDCLYEIYSDPLVEIFNMFGLSTLVWEKLEERWPRCLPSAWITRLLTIEISKTPPLPELIKPSWFRELAVYTKSITGKDLIWSDVASAISHVQLSSIVFERWLQEVGAKLLIVIGWYDLEMMAATLAARRLGITSVDLQHGIQYRGHYAYTGWVKSLCKGYEVVPDVFWCWGYDSAVRLERDNPAFDKQSEIIIGGNLWFNKWRSGDIVLSDVRIDEYKRKLKGFNNVITVTLQHAGNFNELIADIIKIAPDDWFWFMRFHPGTLEKERSYVMNLLNSISSTNIEFDFASKAPLYSLFQYSQVHITGSSTCAHEALGFGIPSVITDEEGFDIFRKYIEAGVMLYATNPEDAVSMIYESKNIEKESCLKVSARVFASRKESQENILNLLSGKGLTKMISSKPLDLHK